MGDVDQDGFDDIFVTYWGANVLFRNTGKGGFRAAAWGDGRVEYGVFVCGL